MRKKRKAEEDRSDKQLIIPARICNIHFFPITYPFRRKTSTHNDVEALSFSSERDFYKIPQEIVDEGIHNASGNASEHPSVTLLVFFQHLA